MAFVTAEGRNCFPCSQWRGRNIVCPCYGKSERRWQIYELAGQYSAGDGYLMGNSSAVARVLESRQLLSGGWSFTGSKQATVEATCLAALALAGETQANTRAAIQFLLKSQLTDGGWPAFEGDSEGSWTTALALCVAIGANEMAEAGERALNWLLEERGREGHWFWRWKFKTVDRNVHFNPDKYGWPWSHGAASWVIPTAFSVVALKQLTACNRARAPEKRIRLGVEMLLDRACVGGGWNSGNSVVYGAPLRPHVETTAIALLALQGEERSPIIRAGLAWLKDRASSIASAESLAWCILSLFVYQEPVEQLKTLLTIRLGAGLRIQNNATVATALLAMKCGEMIHPFEVLR